MAKKDTAAAVLGMLSAAGDRTRPTGDLENPPEPDHSRAREPMVEPDRPPTPGPDTQRPGAPRGAAPREVPRTLRLRLLTAAAVRDAWLEAKRDDVLLSHQDFASDLLDEALAQRARRAARTED